MKSTNMFLLIALLVTTSCSVFNRQDKTMQKSASPTSNISRAIIVSNTADVDCLGVPEGTAEIDACGVCDGGNASCTDCKGVLFGSAEFDACGVCGGDNSCPFDCNNEAYGAAVEDQCGSCGGDDSSCTDCEGVLWGEAQRDLCGICQGDNSSCVLLRITSLKVLTPAGIDTGLNGKAGDTLQIFGVGLEYSNRIVLFNSRVVLFTYIPQFRILQGEIPTGVEGTNIISAIGINGIPAVANQILTVNTLAGAGQIVTGTPNITNCVTHAGKPYPWEGTGACTGNNMVTIPIGATGLSLIQNSVTPSGDFGFGLSGFRLAIDYRILKSGPVMRHSPGDGSVISYQPDVSQIWKATLQQLSRSKITIVGSTLIEKLEDESIITYAQLPINGNVYGVISIVKPNGKSISIERNTMGNIKRILKGNTKSTVSNFVVVTTISYDPTERRAQIVTDADNNNYQLLYSADNLETVVYPDGFSSWQMQYASTRRIINVKDISNGVTLYDYTVNGLLRQITMPDRKIIKYNYANGFVETRGFMSNVDETINARGAVEISTKEKLDTHFTYDSLNQVKSMTDNLGLVTHYTHELQRLKTVTSPNQNVTTFTYNNNTGKVLSATTVGPTSTLTTNYSYYSSNNLLASQIGPGTYRKTIGYDSNNNINRITINNINVMTATYNSSHGNLETLTSNGTSTSYGYDNNNNNNLISAPTGSISLLKKPSGLVERITAPGLTEERNYDSVGRPIQIVRSSPGTGRPSYTNTIQYGVGQVQNTDSLGNGVRSSSSATGGYSTRTKVQGSLGEDYSSGYDVSEPTYTNP